MLVQRNCIKCDKKFKVHSCYSKKFCSRKCYFKSRKEDYEHVGQEEVICENCGDKFVAYKSNHRRFCSGSCGAIGTKRLVTHGDSYTQLHRNWMEIRARCKSKKGLAFKYYTSCGISVCKEWANSYEIFKEWSLENGYEEGLSLDRIKNEKGYSPKNCRWIPKYFQNVNKSKRKTGKETSKYKGVTVRTAGKIYAGICVKGKFYYLGKFWTEEQAAKAYDKKAFELWGEFAALNFRKKGIKC